MAGEKKDAKLIEKAILSIKYPLKDIKIFHSNRGNEYDNAVSEAVNKIMKTEFIYQNKFKSLEELQLALAEYNYWYNNFRVHGPLGYLTPVEYRELNKEQLVA